MDYEIAWTEPALVDVDQTIAFVAGQNPTSAEALRDQILSSVTILQKFPGIGPIYGPDRRAGTRQIVCKSYRIFTGLMKRPGVL